MITAGTDLRVLVATRPVDFRKQADGLAAIVQAALGADPFCGFKMETYNQYVVAPVKAPAIDAESYKTKYYELLIALTHGQ